VIINWKKRKKQESLITGKSLLLPTVHDHLQPEPSEAEMKEEDVGR